MDAGASWVRGKHLQSTQIAYFELSELSEGPQHLLVRAIDAYGRPGCETKVRYQVLHPLEATVFF